MMAVLFFTFVLLAVFHFIYESILLPEQRLSMRYELFALRDELRMLKHEKGEEINDVVFNQIDKSICSATNHLPILTFSFLFSAVRVIDKDTKLKGRIKKKRESIDNHELLELKKISTKLQDITLRAVVFNSGGWLYIFIPFVLIALIFQQFGRLKNWISNSATSIIMASNRDYEMLEKGYTI